jgi:hypothetical protein
VGDNAYPPSEWLVPIFGGLDRLYTDNDIANFYMSQSRIRVEMSFGMMSNRFGLFRSPLRTSPHNLGPLIQTMARLHNYILTENNDYDPYLTTDTRAQAQQMGGAGEEGRETNGDPAQPVTDVSLMHNEIVRRVREAVLVGPK